MQPGVAEEDAPAFDRPDDAAAGQRLEGIRGWRISTPRSRRAGHDRGRQRMLAGLLDGRRQSQHIGVGERR